MMFNMDFVELAYEVDVGRHTDSKALVRALIEEISPYMHVNLRTDGIDGTKILVALAFYAANSYRTLVGQSQCHTVSQLLVSWAINQVTEVLNKSYIFKKYVTFPSSRQNRDDIKEDFIASSAFLLFWGALMAHMLL